MRDLSRKLDEAHRLATKDFVSSGVTTQPGFWSRQEHGKFTRSRWWQVKSYFKILLRIKTDCAVCKGTGKVLVSRVSNTSPEDAYGVTRTTKTTVCRYCWGKGKFWA